MSPQNQDFCLSLGISVYTQKIFSYKQAKKRPVGLILVGSPHHKGNSYNSTGMLNYRVFFLYVKRLINYIFYIYILVFYRNTVTEIQCYLKFQIKDETGL